MSFQLPGNNAQSAGGFSFGSPNTPTTTAQPAAAKPGGFSFGATGGGDAGAKPAGFGLWQTTSTTTSVAATPTTSAATSTATFGSVGGGTSSFGFGATAAVSTTMTTTAQPAAPAFGATSTNAQPTSTAFGLGATPATTSVAAAASSAPASSVSTSAAPSASLTSGFSAFAAPATTASVTVTSTTTATPLLTAPAQSTATSTTSGFASLTTATKTTDSSTMPPNASTLTYNQLEEHINKWTLELEEQEKVFTDQATQINAWDKILISNNQKILDLNDAVQKVKTDQQTLEQELEFISTQHKELEESILPLQKEFLKIPQVDVERSQTYLMVENLDTQLKQMSEDLKEIIDNLNESNKCQDNSDPIIQIGKILNAHMSSLQWIEQSTSTIGNKLEDITKMHETFKRDSERSFRSAYYN